MKGWIEMVDVDIGTDRGIFTAIAYISTYLVFLAYKYISIKNACLFNCKEPSSLHPSSTPTTLPQSTSGYMYVRMHIPKKKKKYESVDLSQLFSQLNSVTIASISNLPKSKTQRQEK